MEQTTITALGRKPRAVNNMRSITDNIHGYGKLRVLLGGELTS